VFFGFSKKGTLLLMVGPPVLIVIELLDLFEAAGAKAATAEARRRLTRTRNIIIPH
jgi:hypothetical protein